MTRILPVFVLLAACGTTQKVRDVETAGFLEDYSILEPGGTDEQPALVYVKPGVDWKHYDKMLLDPVTVWRSAHHKELSQEELQAVANLAYSLLHRALEKDYKMVTEPGARTLRLTVAITKARESNPTMDVVSTVTPVGLVFSGLAQTFTGRPPFTGSAAVEAKTTDASSGELLAAAVDERVGGKNLTDTDNSWADVDKALAWWAARFRYAFCVRRGDKDCVKPDKGKKEFEPES